MLYVMTEGDLIREIGFLTIRLSVVSQSCDMGYRIRQREELMQRVGVVMTGLTSIRGN